MAVRQRFFIPELVIREVALGVTTFSKPFTGLGFLHLGGRSVAVKLSSGDVWILASTPLSQETKEALDKMGPLKWIMAGNAFHHMYIAYPDAKLIGMKGLVEKKQKEGITLDGAFGVDPPETKYGFEDEIYPCYFSGRSNGEVAFLHAPTKSLIVSDLIFNLPCTEQYSKTKITGRIPIIGDSLAPGTWLHGVFARRGVTNIETMSRDAKTVLEWQPARIIPAHGDVIEKDAPAKWAEVYRQFLSP
uniref:Metallo-beta-lactamase domain-containing protein n=1 Tax=Mycena chlorophos TaxID=658473 RepID=A0ABQ0LW47_MYCCL|nr:predicted protein [Mycena chlorophos]